MVPDLDQLAGRCIGRQVMDLVAEDPGMPAQYAAVFFLFQFDGKHENRYG
jgi:hypothetical protein